MRTIRIILYLSSLILYSLCVQVTSVAQTPPGFRLLPRDSGLGVGSKLQMVIVKASSTLSGSFRSGPVKFISVTWKSSDTQIALVSNKGKVFGRRKGKVLIIATVKVAPRSIFELQSHIEVGSPVTALLVASLDPIPHYCERPIKVQTLGSHNKPIENRVISWKVKKNDEIVSLRRLVKEFPVPLTVSQSNIDLPIPGDNVLARGIKPGRALVNITCEGISKEIIVSVSESVAAATLNFVPEQIVLDVQETKTVAISAQNSEGCNVWDLWVNWHLADITVAAIVRRNAITCDIVGLKSGSTKLIAATEAGLSGSIDVTVPGVSSVSITPSSITTFPLQFVGSTVDFTATPRSSSGNALRNRVVTWSALHNRISIEPSTGYTVTAKVIPQLFSSDPFDAQIVALSEGVTATADIHVRFKSYCEQYTCYSYYQVQNSFSDGFVLVRERKREVGSDNWQEWVFKKRVEAGSSWQSEELDENYYYMIAADYLIPHLGEVFYSTPFHGGSGSVAYFTAHPID